MVLYSEFIFLKLMSKNEVDEKQIEQGYVSFGYSQLANCE